MSADASDPGPSESLGRLGLYAFNAAFWPYLALSTAALFVPAVGIWAATAPFDPKKTLLRRYTEEWGAHYLERAPFAGVTVRGRDKIDLDRPCVYVSNHASMVDILAIFSARLPALWVSKVENFYAPALGWNMWLNGYIPVRRGFLPSIMTMMRTCLARLAEGRSLIVFPEGTRSTDGKLRSFFRGAFFLGARAKVPIVPLCLDGTRDVLGKGSMLVRPRQVSVNILDPIDPARFAFDSRKLRDATREAMTAELDRMRRSP
ncbi:MAG TPA: lysophospholipid acyltransferase family protein [Polyangiaceae bacterium]|jgi:1-acyl-sn-glycerol-3-phosphate acyltransferase|nr:lysophospholipid acyltransferase family protein [Polyangiaceae bacterium]